MAVSILPLPVMRIHSIRGRSTAGKVDTALKYCIPGTSCPTASLLAGKMALYLPAASRLVMNYDYTITFNPTGFYQKKEGHSKPFLEIYN